MGALTTALIAIAGLVLGWIAIEIACKSCLEKGRETIDRNLNPNYDPDDEENNVRAPLNPNPTPTVDADDSDSTSTSTPSVIRSVYPS